MGIMKRLYTDPTLRRQYRRLFGTKKKSVKKIQPAKVKLKFAKKKGTVSIWRDDVYKS